MIHNSIQSKVPTQEQISKKKTLKDLNMMDAFLFDVSTEKKEDAIKIARAIIRRATGHKLTEFIIENQKQFPGADLGKRGIRMDLWLRETEKDSQEKAHVRIYDIEPNIYKDNFPYRSRFYQAKVDAKELSAGAKFSTLPELIMIWILPNDPFGEDRMLYTVKNMVVENNELVYNDGVLKLFLYTNGNKGGSEELKALLKYFEETTQENAVDEELKEIQEIIGTIKESSETEERYMTLQEIIDYEKEYSYNDGVQAGIQQGIQQGIRGIIRTCRKLNLTKEETIEALMENGSITEVEAKEYIKLYWQEESVTN